MSKVTATPTGCPGPIPGTKVWRCDGENCCYGPYNYASCKGEIAKRGYVLRLSNDLVQDMLKDKELVKACAQGKLDDVQALLDKTVQEDTAKQTAMLEEVIELSQNVAKLKDELSCCKQMLDNGAKNEEGVVDTSANDSANSDSVHDSGVDTEVTDEAASSN